MNISTEKIKELETKLNALHIQLVMTRDTAQVAIQQLRDIREELSKAEVGSLKAELAEQTNQQHADGEGQ